MLRKPRTNRHVQNHNHTITPTQAAGDEPRAIRMPAGPRCSRLASRWGLETHLFPMTTWCLRGNMAVFSTPLIKARADGQV